MCSPIKKIIIVVFAPKLSICLFCQFSLSGSITDIFWIRYRFRFYYPDPLLVPFCYPVPLPIIIFATGPVNENVLATRIRYRFRFCYPHLLLVPFLLPGSVTGSFFATRIRYWFRFFYPDMFYEADPSGIWQNVGKKSSFLDLKLRLFQCINFKEDL